MRPSTAWWQDARARLAAQRRNRLVAATVARDTTPPPPSAFASFGAGSWIVPPARVTMPEVISIGERVVIHEHAWISVVECVPGVRPRLVIGDRVQIGAGCHIACVGEIEIGDEVLTAARIYIGDTYHGYEDPNTSVIDQPMAPPAKVTIGRGAFIGIGAVVLQGVTVGEQAYIGAGAVVTSDVPDRTLVVGNPARAVRRFDSSARAWVALGAGTSAER